MHRPGPPKALGDVPEPAPGYVLCVQAGKCRRERLDVEGRLGQLPLGGGSAATLHVQQAHGHLDQRVVEEPQRIRALAPLVLQRFVGIPVAACTEQLKARLQTRGEGGIILRFAAGHRAEGVRARGRPERGVKASRRYQLNRCSFHGSPSMW